MFDRMSMWAQAMLDAYTYRRSEVKARREAADLIDKSSRFLTEHGWTKGKWSRPDGTVCALGAVRRASGAYDEYGCLLPGMEASHELEVFTRTHEELQACLKATGFYTTWIPDWNDHPDTTERDVHNLFHSCAQRLRRKKEKTS